MARYIDADALIKKIFPMGIGDGMYTINAKAVKFAIDNAPTADVVPKSEVEKLQEAYNNRLAKDIQTNADFVKYAKAEAAREIFEAVRNAWETTYYDQEFRERLDNLEKKYTEEEGG